jgi:uncharacterized protein YndB with AHSA1/START domain
MAIGVVLESGIRRTSRAVFARIADIERWPDWLVASGIRRVERSSDGPLEVGERLVVEQSAAGREARFEAEVRAFEPPGRLTIAGRDRDGVSIDIDATLEAVDVEGVPGTLLRWSIRIGVPFRYRIFESLARPQVERAAALDIEGLRVALESAADD